MAEEFQGGVCGGNWWNSSRNLFGSTPCSMAINDVGSFGWPNHDLIIMDMKTTRSSDDSAGSASDGSSSVVLQDVQKPQQTTANGNMSIDSTLQMMGISLSSSATADHDWTQNLLHDSGRSEENYSNILQEAAGLNSRMNYEQETRADCPQIHKGWSSKNFCEDSSINSFKQEDQSFPLVQQPFNSITSSTAECAATCQGLSPSFPLNSASYSYTSSLLQTLFDTDSPPQQSLIDNQTINYSPATNYRVNSDEFLPSLPKDSPMVKPSFAKQQPANYLPFTNNTPLWNGTAAALSDVRPSFLPSAQSQFLPSSLNNKKPNLPSFTAKNHGEEARALASVAKKASNVPAFKRPRIETPSPLPTFKVRKEKMGDRITALQQLVSPFGKTDTASVLHEAIECIKFLHDQVSGLSTPYMKKGSPPVQRQWAAEDQEGLNQDLKSRGLCLVPISSTFPVAAETTTDFWTPMGGSFR